MAVGSWERVVREQVGLGRLLPLGAAADGTWIAERAAAGVLRRAAAEVREARVTALRIGLADPDDEVDAQALRGQTDPGADVRCLGGPGVGPAPVSALGYGELRVSVRCDVSVERAVTATAAALRAALLRGADERLGLLVAAVDVHVAGLLEARQAAAQPGPGVPPAARETHAGHRAPDVPGLLGSDVLRDRDHAEVRVVLDSAHRALDVALAVRAATDAATVTVLVTDIR